MCMRLYFIVSVILTLTAASYSPPDTFDCSGENIVYDPCPRCRMIYCEDLKKPLVCDNNAKCIPRCRCANGYLINYDQTCVPISDCLRCTGPNEYFSSGITCDTTCKNLNAVCDATEKSTERCYCKHGFARDENNVCIPINKCKFPKCEDPNAEFLLCKRCVGSCDNREVMCSLGCYPACSCKEGYVYTSSKNRTCIKESLCEDKRCPGKHEYYTSCLSDCPQNCPDQNGRTVCTAAAPTACRPGCQCIREYLRSNGTCVAPEDCPAFVCDIRPNEVYSKCGENCTETCASVLKRELALCRDNTNCFPECLCKKGYVRSGVGRCVLKKLCGSCKNPFEDYSDCGPIQEPTCQNQSSGVSTICKAGCFCRLGYLRNGNKCVRIQDCPPLKSL